MIKCLKRLCTLLLIGLPIFLTSFSSAFESTGNYNEFYRTDVNEPNIIGQNSYLINNKGTMFTNDYKFFWLKRQDNDYPSKVVFGWVNGQLYYAFSYANNIAPDIQGTVDYFCVSDDITTDSYCSNYNYPASDFYNSNKNFIEFLFRSTRNSPVFADQNGNYIIFYDGTYYYWAGVSPNGDYRGSSVNTGNSINLTRLDLEYLEGLNVWGNSPFTSSTPINTGVVVPDYEFNENDDFTNGQIIQGFNAMGLTDEFCYGGYQINDIFSNGENPEDFIGYRWGGGAFIFDLWNVYKDDFSGDYISFIRTFYVAYDTNNLAQFYGYSKAVYGWVNQWFSVSSNGLGFLESSAPMFTLKDVWDYCNLRFYADSSSIYTGDNWNAKYRYYTSGQVNLGGYFSFSGNNSYFSGTLSGFDEPDNFFGSLNAIFQGGLQEIVSNKVGVLPSYIILFLFAIILIRILSH